MSHKNIITIHFHIWTWYTPTILISRACHGLTIKNMYSNIAIYGGHRGHRDQVAGTRQNFEVVHINWTQHVTCMLYPRYYLASTKFRAAKNRVRLAGVTEKAGPKCRSSSESERKLHENMLATCSLMYKQLFFIACNIKKCFWLQLDWSEPLLGLRLRQKSSGKWDKISSQ